MPTDIEIAQAATLRSATDVASELGLDQKDLRPYGHHIAKILPSAFSSKEKNGKLVLVTGMTPTPKGEGKSTVAVGLAQALRKLEKKVVLCLREPSLGPVFGIKGGAAGGGYSQVLPMDEINLHFTGDFHAITSAHSLLSASMDNALHFGKSELDVRRINWRRAVDMNDRSLRQINVGLGGTAGGMPREDGFTITAASEIMAIFCLAKDLDDFRDRVDRIVLGFTRDWRPVRAAELGVSGGLALLLKDALAPNLVQTIEGGPALVHGGPFANIAHGCNSLIATEAGLRLGDIVVTEAGFGSDLGAEKFFDIKCRAGGLSPEAAVVVATVRALKHHGGEADDAAPEISLAMGLANLQAHVENVRQFGVPVLVALNRFSGDSPADLAHVQDFCARAKIACTPCNIWEEGGEGGLDLGRSVLEMLELGGADFAPIYGLDTTLEEKLNVVATRVYGADKVELTSVARKELARFEKAGLGDLPVCIAKTQYSFSDDPKRLGRPRGFDITVRQLRISAGAGFIVALTGDVMTMPGLPRVPAAVNMSVEADGTITGLS